MKKFLVAVAWTVLTTPVWATSKTATLSVPSMDCEVCPITVKKALTKVSGVSQADVNFDKRQAIVTFDDSKASVDVLTRATMGAWLSVHAGDGHEMNTIILESTLTCPNCGHSKTETMPTDACQWFYECEQCHAMLNRNPVIAAFIAPMAPYRARLFMNMASGALAAVSGTEN